jgi:CheY-like chemotaxis protein
MKRKVTVLVVEDDPDVADAVRRGLLFAGFAVELATDGRSALTAIASAPPDAPSKCPIMLLVLDTASLYACGPNTLLRAIVSALSPSSVLVPWALM